jgi:FkbM family methyltransferase
MRNLLRRRLNFSIPMKIRGQRVWLPVRGGVEAHAVRDSWKTKIIDEHAPHDGLFVDAGANLGQTLIDVRVTRKSLGYVGFEPNPHCASYISTLVSANRYEDCLIVPVALSDRAGVAEFFSPHDGSVDPGSNIREGLRPEMRAQHLVPTLAFDSIRSQLGPRKIAFMKIDVEGAELEVLNGMQRTIKEERPAILCEVLPSVGGRDADESGKRRSQLHELVAQLGYDIHHVKRTGDSDVQVVGVDHFLDEPFSRKKSWDYLLLPR